MGTPPHEPFDQGLFRTVKSSHTSAGAGFIEFDAKWMASENIWFCNTINAVAEVTADMAIFLRLAVLLNPNNDERSAKAGIWGEVPGRLPRRDPLGPTWGS